VLDYFGRVARNMETLALHDGIDTRYPWRRNFDAAVMHALELRLTNKQTSGRGTELSRHYQRRLGDHLAIYAAMLMIFENEKPQKAYEETAKYFRADGFRVSVTKVWRAFQNRSVFTPKPGETMEAWLERERRALGASGLASGS